MSSRTGNGISESCNSVADPSQHVSLAPCFTHTRYEDEPLTWYHNTKVQAAQRTVNVQSRSGVTLTPLPGSPSHQPQTNHGPVASQERLPRPWGTAGESWEDMFIPGNPSQQLPQMLSWKHCFSLMETNSSGPNCGCNRVNTCGQCWGQDVTVQPLSATAPSQDHPWVRV